MRPYLTLPQFKEQLFELDSRFVKYCHNVLLSVFLLSKLSLLDTYLDTAKKVSGLKMLDARGEDPEGHFSDP